MRAFAKPLAAALGALLSGDRRRRRRGGPCGSHRQNPNCETLDLPSLFKVEGAVERRRTSASRGTVSEDGKYLDVTPAEGVSITAVIVKGGQNDDGQGHEVYDPTDSWQDLTPT